MRLVEGALAANLMPGPRAGIGKVVLHVDPASLTGPGDMDGERCRLENGPALPTETARRLACDASVVVISESGGPGIDVGRSTRTISPALRRALEHRDGGCRFPGCERRSGVDAHHLKHWAHGGGTDRSNLLLLCRFHHRLVHEGGFRVGRQRDEIVFRRPDGQRLETLPRKRTGRASALIDAQADLGIDATTPITQGYTKLDLNYAVGVICDAQEHARAAA